MVYSEPMINLDRVFHDPQYASVYAKAGHLARQYGPPQWMVWSRHGIQWNKKRIQNLNHIRVLRLALPGWEVTDLDQVVEFGGGSGDLAAAFRDLGYRGTHFVVDLPAMNLLHYYWQRYSGLPSILGDSLPCNAAVAKGQIVLESSADVTQLRCHIDSSVDDKSIFFATYSFTEADIPSRERIRPLFDKFGTIFIAFWSTWEKKDDNDEYMQKLLDEGLEETHYVLAWKTYGPGFYFLARRRDLGPVLCHPEANCHWYTMHHSLPRGGLRQFLLERAVVSVLVLGVIFVCAYQLHRRATEGDAKSM